VVWLLSSMQDLIVVWFIEIIIMSLSLCSHVLNLFIFILSFITSSMTSVGNVMESRLTNYMHYIVEHAQHMQWHVRNVGPVRNSGKKVLN
jgi:hypothetical protein